MGGCPYCFGSGKVVVWEEVDRDEGTVTVQSRLETCSECNGSGFGKNETEEIYTESDVKNAFDDGYQAGYEAAKPKWISVEDEQKPRHGKEYLCVCALPDDPKHEWDWIMTLRWCSHGSNGLVDRPHFTDEGLNGMYVTHWMPTPKLPKEE